jgi:phytoene dehydrogenase-like protein
LGDSPNHRAFWVLLDKLADVFWKSSRAGVKLPIQSVGDCLRAAQTITLRDWPLVRYVGWTVGDALRRYSLRGDKPLCALLAMLLEDTVHAQLDEAPLINGALGITIRGAGLTRAAGGMAGFWKRLMACYQTCGGILRLGCPVDRINQSEDGTYWLANRRGNYQAVQVVSALPATLTAQIAPATICKALRPFLDRDVESMGGAVVAYLGVPEDEVAGQTFTHHQLFQDYNRPLGNGNNMFVSVSAAGDLESAPTGHRAVMISTHCDLAEWEGLNEDAFQHQKKAIGIRLVDFARRVYPNLGRRAIVFEIGTPRTFERFTRRPRGAVGGVRQSLANSNQNALPHQLGVPGFYMVGDSTWPGLGTVACVLGSRIVAAAVRRRANELSKARKYVSSHCAPLQEKCHAIAPK